jgi:hypothetical protein
MVAFSFFQLATLQLTNLHADRHSCVLHTMCHFICAVCGVGLTVRHFNERQSSALKRSLTNFIAQAWPLVRLYVHII